MKKYLSKTWLRLQFVTNKKSIDDIAAECNVNSRTIRRKLEEFELIKKR
ncbi:helix-turn-helix DNA binding domain protein [Streptomyces phage Patelgo]|nr:helix-turn-helix DNA binding domain protein [Streptomyces phage Patelgo]